MKRFAAVALLAPALLLAADSLAQVEEDYPPPPAEDYGSPPAEVDNGDSPGTRPRPRDGKRERRRRNRNSTERDAAVALGGLILGEIIDEIGDQPRSRPRGCSYERAGGWMQPTQGAWQDDEVFDFVPIGGRPSVNSQLEMTSPWGVYRAHLPMVDERPTALVGARFYRDARGNEHPTGGDRSAIVIRGSGNCTTRVPVKVRFTLEDADGVRVLYETSQLPKLLPLEGPPKPEPEEFDVSLPAELGLPADATFLIQGENGSPYRITGEIVRADTNAATGLKVEVEGTVQVTRDFVVKFVPLILGDQTQERSRISPFQQYVRDLSDLSEKHIPDLFPMRPRGLKTYTGELVNASRFDPARLPRNHTDYLPPGLDPTDPQKLTPRQQQFLVAVGDYLATSAMMSYADRVIAVVRHDEVTGDEYEWLNSGLTEGFAANRKVAFVRAVIRARTGAYADPAEKWHVVAHELTHTFPRVGWDEHDTPAACGQNIHNTGTPLGHGLQLMQGGRPYREVRRGSGHMMGGGGGNRSWISQCTFARLIDALGIDPDPELFLVRAIVSRRDGAPSAKLMPGYDLMGVSDVAEGLPGAWSLRLKDASGRALAQWPVSPAWRNDAGEMDVASVVLRVPALPQARLLEVVHADRVVATRPIPTARPALAVAPPRVDAARRSVRLAWAARAADGSPVLSSVFYSTNGGHFYDERMFEQRAGQAVIDLDPAPGVQHVFRIVVTDGARSAEQVVRLP